MLIDKEWYWDSCVNNEVRMNVAIHQLEAAYLTTNNEEDVAYIQALLDEHSLGDEFNWLVVNSVRLFEMSQIGSPGCMPVAATILGEMPTIIFDAGFISHPDLGLTFEVMMAHELTHIHQFTNKEVTVDGMYFNWHVGEEVVSYYLPDTRVMFGEDYSLAYQYALPWEGPAYDAELAFDISDQRRNSILIAQKLAPAAALEYAKPNLRFRNMLLWVEFTTNVLMKHGHTLQSAGDAIQRDSEKNPLSIVNACKEILKARASKNAENFNMATQHLPL